MDQVKHVGLIGDRPLAEALQKSGVYEAGVQGVNVQWQGKIYNIAAKYQSATRRKAAELFVRILGDETCWVATFAEEKEKDYWDCVKVGEAKKDTFKKVVVEGKQAPRAQTPSIEAQHDAENYSWMRGSCTELIPFRELLELHYHKEFVPRLLELELTADPKGVNVLHNAEVWNLSIHFSNANLPPRLCLKSSNVLTTLEGRAIQPFSTDKEDFYEVLRNCLKDDQTIEVPFNGEYVSGAEDYLKSNYPTLVENHGAPEPQREEQKQPPSVAGSKDQESKSSDWNTTAWVLGSLAILLLLGIGYSYRQSLWGRSQSA